MKAICEYIKKKECFRRLKEKKNSISPFKQFKVCRHFAVEQMC